jgi:hypothetical protein
MLRREPRCGEAKKKAGRTRSPKRVRPACAGHSGRNAHSVRSVGPAPITIACSASAQRKRRAKGVGTGPGGPCEVVRACPGPGSRIRLSSCLDAWTGPVHEGGRLCRPGVSRRAEITGRAPREASAPLRVPLGVRPRRLYLSCRPEQTSHSTLGTMPCGRKRKRHKIATHKRKKRLRKNRHKKKNR